MRLYLLTSSTQQFSEKVTREALNKFAGSVKIICRTMANLLYANYDEVIVSSMNELQDLFTKENFADNKSGHMLNANKTKVVKWNKAENGNDYEKILFK